MAILVLLVATGCTGSGPPEGKATSGAPTPGARSGGDPNRPTPTPNPVVVENSRPGTTAWKRSRTGPSQLIEGYADKIAVRPGDSFRLFVSTTAPGFSATAFRVGWYGGTGGREVWTSPRIRGIRQVKPVVERPLNTVVARWKPSATVSTKGWPEGNYLIKLRSEAGYENYVPITVRSTSTSGKVVLVNGVTTWQAYNLWGGYDLYEGPTGYSDRSRAVSFDRPYDDAGMSRFLSGERPAIVLAERLGVPLAYITDIELATDPGLLAGARALITLGHDEYWTSSMRTNTIEAREAGTNLAFLGANAIFRHARLASTALGPNRLVICYKSFEEDPIRKTNPSEATQDWRFPPDPRPESVLTGLMYDCFPANAAFVVTNPTNWLFAGTGVRKGTKFPNLVGVESDRLDLRKPTPRPIEILSDSPVLCGTDRRTWANSAYYTVGSGAGVFNTGTLRWVQALGHSKRFNPRTWRFVEQVTANLLRGFAQGPAGRRHPARDNADDYTHGR
ncbi:N,N-dimethylformamidase beta subunit family domain-containing protein [Actinopolymorpha alba]|uniref:N,N-dimethylformamidase beta subunit family domain-containing protein n=1 Tax=Actinopolymorpha alba TaxID=533267 RepID=UPI00192CC6A6|nr:N,N-dimethylformamidase beta subunit family domain-containing protein [Actinopolymorpha alba]